MLSSYTIYPRHRFATEFVSFGRKSYRNGNQHDTMTSRARSHVYGLLSRWRCSERLATVPRARGKGGAEHAAATLSGRTQRICDVRRRLPALPVADDDAASGQRGENRGPARHEYASGRVGDGRRHVRSARVITDGRLVSRNTPSASAAAAEAMTRPRAGQTRSFAAAGPRWMVEAGTTRRGRGMRGTRARRTDPGRLLGGAGKGKVRWCILQSHRPRTHTSNHNIKKTRVNK